MCEQKEENVKTQSECVCTCSHCLHLAHSSLDDGIKASLRGISVPGHHLLPHLLCEAPHFLCQREDMFVAKLGQASCVNAVEKKQKKTKSQLIRQYQGSKELLPGCSFIITSIFTQL